MIKEALHKAFENVFECLGVDAFFTSRHSSTSKKIRVTCKYPENIYEAGTSEILGQVAEISCRATDATPQIGDLVQIENQKYKIHEEPLLDASNIVWKFSAVLIDKN